MLVFVYFFWPCQQVTFSTFPQFTLWNLSMIWLPCSESPLPGVSDSQSSYATSSFQLCISYWKRRIWNAMLTKGPCQSQGLWSRLPTCSGIHPHPLTGTPSDRAERKDWDIPWNKATHGRITTTITAATTTTTAATPTPNITMTYYDYFDYYIHNKGTTRTQQSSSAFTSIPFYNQGSLASLFHHLLPWHWFEASHENHGPSRWHHPRPAIKTHGFCLTCDQQKDATGPKYQLCSLLMEYTIAMSPIHHVTLWDVNSPAEPHIPPHWRNPMFRLEMSPILKSCPFIPNKIKVYNRHIQPRIIMDLSMSSWFCKSYKSLKPR